MLPGRHYDKVCPACSNPFRGLVRRIYCSVGCAQKANPGRAPQHGHSKSPEHAAWRDMKSRCMNPKVRCYPRYGGRGISICERWMDFENFLADMGLRPGEGYSIERDDSNGNYEPSNCRWATKLEQARNRAGVYTPAQDQIVRDAVARGLKPKQIAALVGKSIISVQSRAYRLGLNFGGRHPARMPTDLISPANT